VRRYLKFAVAALALSNVVEAAETAAIGPDVTLRVRVESVTSTDLYPADPCIDAGECIPFHFWYRYRATVLERIAGTLSVRHVKFANLQHAHYVRTLTRDWMVRLTPCPPAVSEALKVTYCVIDHALSNDRSKRRALRAAAPNTSLERTRER
jgi:hypothetical protein